MSSCGAVVFLKTNLISGSHAGQTVCKFANFFRQARPRDGLDCPISAPLQNMDAFQSSGESPRVVLAQSCLRGGSRATRKDKVAVLCREKQHKKKNGKKIHFHLHHAGDPTRVGAPGFPLRSRGDGLHRAQIPVPRLLQCSGSSAAVHRRHGEAEGRWEA